jgi:diguanylate cyclase (GGDEF)-like protein/putative nucleotidyltransferase with HDIG domain
VSTTVPLVLVDIDGFKALNDQFGHRFGDEALRAFADLCRDELRMPDLVSRVGGEEFAIVLPRADERNALAVAERLRRAVRSRMTAADGRTLSASFGIASFPKHGSDPEVLLDHADQAMYAAKHLGRDRTVIFCDGLLDSVRDASPAEHLQAVLVMAEALDLRDVGTADHSQTVGRLCANIAVQLGLPRERVERIRSAGILHDIGKLGVPDHILHKPGRLTDDEMAEMHRHAELGARMVSAAGDRARRRRLARERQVEHHVALELLAGAHEPVALVERYRTALAGMRGRAHPFDAGAPAEEGGDLVQRRRAVAAALVALVDEQLPEEVRDVVAAGDLVGEHHEPDRRVVGFDDEAERARIRMLGGLAQGIGDAGDEAFLSGGQAQRLGRGAVGRRQRTQRDHARNRTAARASAASAWVEDRHDDPTSLPLLWPAGQPGPRRHRPRLGVPQRGVSRVRPAAARRRGIAPGAARSGRRRRGP